MNSHSLPEKISQKPIEISSGARTEPLKRTFWVVIVLYLILLPSRGITADPVKYRLYMYKNQESTQSTTVFSPHDQIFIFIRFINLPKGEYTFHADWYNSFGELQESSRYAFSLAEPSDHSVESWLEIKQAGFLNRLFSVSETTGYNLKFYGQWQVKIFLNGEEIAVSPFEIR